VNVGPSLPMGDAIVVVEEARFAKRFILVKQL
jgi:hypothetical protein